MIYMWYFSYQLYFVSLQVTARTQDIILVFALFTSKGGLIEPSNFCKILSNSSLTPMKSLEPDPRLGNPGRIIDYVVGRGFNCWTVQSIPIGFAVPILSSIYECRMSPPLAGNFLTASKILTVPQGIWKNLIVGHEILWLDCTKYSNWFWSS